MSTLILDVFVPFSFSTQQYKIVKADIPEDLLAKAIVRTNEAMDKYQIEKVGWCGLLKNTSPSFTVDDHNSTP